MVVVFDADVSVFWHDYLYEKTLWFYHGLVLSSVTRAFKGEIHIATFLLMVCYKIINCFLHGSFCSGYELVGKAEDLGIFYCSRSEWSID